MTKWGLSQEGKVGLIFENQFTQLSTLKKKNQDISGGAGIKNLPASAGDMGLSSGRGRSHMPRSN